MIPDHYYRKFANEELLWCPNDDQETYSKHCLTRIDDLVRFNWLDKKITYKFNSDGFRSEEFKENSIAFLGCSITFGIGLPIEDIYPSLVADKLQMPMANLSVPGSSNDTAFRMAEYWLPRLKPSILILMSPDRSRMELLGNDIANYRVNSQCVKDIFYQKWLLNEENARLNQLKNSLAVAYLCKSLGIKFLKFTVENDFCLVINDLARDLSHPGVKSHLKTANMILNSI